MDVLEDSPGPPGPSNSPEYTVSELSGAVKRLIEGEFGLIRVRGEVGRVSRPASGHLYFDLKDDRNVVAAVSWKGQIARMQVRPEEGMEVIATGRMTTFPGQSKYQLIVEDVALAGAGALMAMLEKRKAALAAEGLFEAARKKPIPYLPEVIGVITSPSGAVIRDILHRLRDRFPRRVLIWPVAVQGERCAPEVAAAIRGFNALAPGGPIPRPDVLIVARGGGSVEDLWGFNEEIVVRAAAASAIPLISAVGHETDTTLIDHAADLRAPTPTAAAELAVPVRAELLAWTAEQEARLVRAAQRIVGERRQRLRDLSRALPRPETLLTQARQRLDLWGERLPAALRGRTQKARLRLAEAPLRPETLRQFLAREARHLSMWADRLSPALSRRARDGRREFTRLAPRLSPEPLHAAARRKTDALAGLAGRFAHAARARVSGWRIRLGAATRLLGSLGYEATLERGYAVVRAEGAVVTTKVAAEGADMLEIQFRDGRLKVGKPAPRAARKPQGPPGSQGNLF
jgi:exodeoxyribonuclease VII large subunit